MKIVRIETFHVKPRWLFLKISTDDGLSGWGEPAAGDRARTVAQAVTDLEPLLIGQDPGRIEHLRQVMFRTGSPHGGPILMSAVSGIEQALWDLAGKAHNLPAYEMLGGACRERIRMLAHCGGVSPQDAAFQAKGLRLKGFTAVKAALEGLLRPLETPAALDRILARFAAIRNEVGRDVDMAVDFGGRLNAGMARRLIALLEPHAPLFIADPVATDQTSALAALSSLSPAPVAVGARFASRREFSDALNRHACSVLQPNVGLVGGIFEARAIALLAETESVLVAPHNPQGPIALAASLQVAACTPNILAVDFIAMNSKWDVGFGYLKTPFTAQEGYMSVPRGPGLGIEVNEDMLRERAYTGQADLQPRHHTDDQSVADL